MASFIPEDKIREVENSADIVEIISEAVRLKKVGRNFVGLCPFHSEKTPSFSVNPEKGIFYCFGCQKGGNIFSFVMEREGIPFPEAVRMIGRRCGIDIPDRPLTPAEKKSVAEQEALLSANRAAMEYFSSALQSPLGARALEYLKKREIPDETIRRFSIGYAPAGWDNLLRRLPQKRISLPLAEKAGLVVSRKEKNGYYDRFRDRIVFPIFDIRNRPIGFGGRVMDDSLPKYLNSPETPLFNKSRTLYGLNSALRKIRELGTVFLVEGYFDVVSLHRHGMQNTVATLGTSLGPEHARLLKGYAREVVLVFDSDDAGIKAAGRSVEIFKKENADVRILILPAGYDPDSFVVERGQEAFLEAAKNAYSVMDFMTESAVKKHGLSIEGKTRVVADMKKFLSSVSDNVKKSLYIKKLAERIGIDESALVSEIASPPKRDRTPPHLREPVYMDHEQEEPVFMDDMPAGNSFARKGEKFEKSILTMMLQFPEIIPEIKNRNVLDDFENGMYISMGWTILNHEASNDGRLSEFMEIFDNNQKNIAASLAVSDTDWKRDDCLKIIGQFQLSRSRGEKRLSLMKSLIDEGILGGSGARAKIPGTV